jgi:acetyltransferase
MQDTKEIYRLLFKPESIAVIGASGNSLKPGGRILKNIREGGYKGRLWPVNPNSPEIMGMPCFADIPALPETPELALISVPAPGVLGALEALAHKGTRAVIILTAGFGETGEEGRAAELEILALTDRYGMKVVGPNCSGFLTPDYAGKFAGIMPKAVPGQVDFVSGSGATVDYVMEQAVCRGLRFSIVVNMGNSIQMGVEDILELLDENHGPESSKTVMLYMEIIRKPHKLLKHVRSMISKGCTFVGIKSGVTTAGAKAAASHTGAMATSDESVQALFDKAGMVRVKSKSELIETACALSALGEAPKGDRACIVTDAGGPGVMLTDELNRNGIEVPSLSEKTIERLQKILPPAASLGNPVDCLPSRNGQQIKAVFDVLCEEESRNLDFAFFVSGNSGMSDNWEIYREILGGKKEWSIPVLPVFSSATTCADLLKKVVDSGNVYFLDEVAAGSAMGKLVNRPVVSDSSVTASGYSREAVGAAMKSSETVLPAESQEKVLEAAGFRLPPQATVSDGAGIPAACEQVGYPVVMKVIGPLHKTDVGGVKVGIRTREEANSAFDELMQIHGAEGVLIQKVVSGVEVILGAVKEEGFGHLVMFGLGGIHTEVLRDVRFALAPLGHDEALNMVRGIRAFPLLEGVRGESGMSLDVLVDYLIRLSLLVEDFPEISEIDLNPVKGTGDDLFVVDARILREGSA